MTYLEWLCRNSSGFALVDGVIECYCTGWVFTTPPPKGTLAEEYEDRIFHYCGVRAKKSLIVYEIRGGKPVAICGCVKNA